MGTLLPQTRLRLWKCAQATGRPPTDRLTQSTPACTLHYIALMCCVVLCWTALWARRHRPNCVQALRWRPGPLLIMSGHRIIIHAVPATCLGAMVPGRGICLRSCGGIHAYPSYSYRRQQVPRAPHSATGVPARSEGPDGQTDGGAGSMGRRGVSLKCGGGWDPKPRQRPGACAWPVRLPFSGSGRLNPTLLSSPATTHCSSTAVNPSLPHRDAIDGQWCVRGPGKPPRSGWDVQAPPRHVFRPGRQACVAAQQVCCTSAVLCGENVRTW